MIMYIGFSIAKTLNHSFGRDRNRECPPFQARESEAQWQLRELWERHWLIHAFNLASRFPIVSGGDKRLYDLQITLPTTPLAVKELPLPHSPNSWEHMVVWKYFRDMSVSRQQSHLWLALLLRLYEGYVTSHDDRL